MSTRISSWDSNSISTLFSSISTSKNKSSSSVLDLDLSTYGLIKSGSYYQMLKSYYTDENSSVKSSTNTSADSAKTLTSIQGATSDLTESAQALYKNGSTAFKQTNGQYDTDAIYKAVSKFVDDYNSTVEAVGKSETDSIAKAGANMVNQTKANAAALSAIGISIDSSKYTLSIDEDTFKKADMSKVKSLFNGNGSFAYSVAVKASMIGNTAKTEASKSATYGSNGNYTYNYQTGELYNSTT